MTGASRLKQERVREYLESLDRRMLLDAAVLQEDFQEDQLESLTDDYIIDKILEDSSSVNFLYNLLEGSD